MANNVRFIHDKIYQSVWRQSSYAALEKRIMISCYIVRKLAESKKITDEDFNSPVKLYCYKNRLQGESTLHSLRIDELYEVEVGKEATKPFSYVANQIIHSHLFLYSFTAINRMDGIIFNSDKSRLKELYRLTLKEFIRVLSPIAQCYVGRTVMQLSPEGKLIPLSDDH